MKKAALAVIILISGVLFSLPAQARILGVNPKGASSDLFSTGGRIANGVVVSSGEFVVDYAGNLIPALASNSQSIGLTGNQWNNIYASSLTITGSATITGTLTQAGNQIEATAGTQTLLGAGSAATFSEVLGLFALPSTVVGNGGGQNFGINASSTIPVNSTSEVLVSSATAGLVALTSTPSIATTTIVGGSVGLPDGTWLILTSSAALANGIVLRSNGSLANSGLYLGAATRALSIHVTLGLKLNCITGSCVWEEQYYTNGAN